MSAQRQHGTASSFGTRLQLRRRVVNVIGFALSGVATLIGLADTPGLLWTLVSRGVQSLSPDLFHLSTPAPGSEGGLANAIFGSVVATIGIAIRGRSACWQAPTCRSTAAARCWPPSSGSSTTSC